MGPIDETTTLFDGWATNGRAEGMESGHRPRAIQALEAMPIAPGDRLLDLGCGNGWATRWLHARTGPSGSTLGIDASPEMIARARAATDGATPIFACGSFDALGGPDGSIDHVFSMEALYYASDLHAALVEAARVLRPGGTLTVCTDFFAENPDCHGWPEMMGIPMTLLSEAGWAAALAAAGFTLEASWRCLDPRSVPADTIGALAVRAVR